MKDEYIAHGYKEDNAIHVQSVSEHNLNVANIAVENCPLSEIKSIIWIIGLLHDAGKYLDIFKEYITKAILEENVRRGEVDHSTGGGFLINELCSKTALSQLVQMVIYSHHGVNDSFSVERNTIFIEERLNKSECFLEIEERYFQNFDRDRLLEWCKEAGKDLKSIMSEIQQFINTHKEFQGNMKKDRYGNKDFYLGMYMRVCLSLLIDADRTDTACFMQKKQLPTVVTDKEIQKIWEESILNLEEYLNKIQNKSRLNNVRKEISASCKEAGLKKGSLYRLTVPTGAGKSLSSLRFALYHAKKYHKRHIIYVAPYQSIIDQNAEEIRIAVGNANIVLEHHCNIIHEEETEREVYELLTENWNCPIIVTTAVQFLNTLFAKGNNNIRRMYSILNSVIIFDEVQSLPVKITKMYNQAVNFLTQFGKSTVILCSATQPIFDELDDNALLTPKNMVDQPDNYREIFKRTKIINAIEKNAKGFSIKELADFVGEKTKQADQILIIVNTKKCAKRIYQALYENYKDKGYQIFHLSTNMCAEHRKETLKQLKSLLCVNQKVICVSTNLIEAGVNLSFQCVIRSLAGLDSIIQAAGRCNRNGKDDIGYVYIVQMEKEAENTDKLKDVYKAQDCMKLLLKQLSLEKVEEYDLSSEQAIHIYYKIYIKAREGELDYHVSVNGINTTLLQLLSKNEIMWNGLSEEVRRDKKNLLFKQFFKTAGELFEVIPEDNKIDVIVEYNERAKHLIDLLDNPYRAIEERKRILRELQPYTVGISEAMKKNLGNAIIPVCDGMALVLSENYYSGQTGVSEQAEGMDFLIS